MHRELHDDEIILSDQAVDRCRRTVEVVIERREGLLEARTALRTRCVLDEVLGDVSERRVITKLQRLLKGHNRLCGRHRVITHEALGSLAGR
jgi:hypothetical protein